MIILQYSTREKDINKKEINGLYFLAYSNKVKCLKAARKLKASKDEIEIYPTNKSQEKTDKYFSIDIKVQRSKKEKEKTLYAVQEKDWGTKWNVYIYDNKEAAESKYKKLLDEIWSKEAKNKEYKDEENRDKKSCLKAKEYLDTRDINTGGYLKMQKIKENSDTAIDIITGENIKLKNLIKGK